MLDKFRLKGVFIKFKENLISSDQGNEKFQKGSGKQIALSIGIVVVTIIFIAGLMFFSSQDTKVTFSDDGIKIHGMYGDSYTWDSIESIELIKELPTIERRTNGSAIGSNLKGHFRTTELGSVKLFVDAQKPPFIYLNTDTGIIIFNMKNEDSTKETFEKILKNLK